MTLHRLAVPLVAAALTLGGCEPREDAPPLQEMDREDTVADIGPVPGELSPIDRSGVRGRTETSRGGDDLRVSVEAEGLEPGSSYSAHVHEGRCAEDGPVRAALGTITADADGRGSVRTEIDGERVPGDADHSIQVHDADDRPVACANLEPGAPGSPGAR